MMIIIIIIIIILVGAFGMVPEGLKKTGKTGDDRMN